MLVKTLLKITAMFWGSDIVLPSTETDDGGIVLLLFLEYMISLIPLHKVQEFSCLLEINFCNKLPL